METEELATVRQTLMETEELATVRQTESNHAKIQSVVSEQVRETAGVLPWYGTPRPGYTLDLDEMTLTGVKFLISVDYMDCDVSITSDCGPDHSTITIKYIKYASL
jgi:hypothetical protein